MATFVLGAIGRSAFGPVGGFVGGILGSFIDSALFGKEQRTEGPRLGDLTAQANSPGAPITIPFGYQVRTAGTVAWTSNLIETKHEDEVEGGKGLGGPSATVVTYTYAIDLALMVCEGPITAILRIWANNKLLYDASDADLFSRADDIRIILGGQTQEPDSMLEAAEGVGNVPAFRGRAMVYFQNLQLADFGNVTPAFSFEVEHLPYSPASAVLDTVNSVVYNLCIRGGLVAAEIDTANLTQEPVRGFAMGGATSPRAAIETLQKFFPFDAADTGAKMVFRQRNRFADLVIDQNDLAAHAADETPPVPEPTVRGQDREIPQEVNFKFVDPARDMDINAVRSIRLITQSKQTLTVQAPITTSAARAKQSVDDFATELWLKRTMKRLRLPPKYMVMDAGDVIQIERAASTLSRRYRVNRVSLHANGVIEAEVHPHLFRWAQGASPFDTGATYILGQTIPTFSNTVLRLFNIPLLTGTVVDSFGFYGAVQDAGNKNRWDGAWSYRALDGSTYERVSRHDFEVVRGSSVTTLPAGPTDYPDRANTLRVRFENGTPATTTDAALQLSANAAIYGADGRWEVIQFRDATQVSGTVWDLSELVRGRKGTEHAVGNHAAGDRFYQLDSARIKRIAQEQSLDDVSVTYKGVTFNQAVADASAITFTNTNEGQRPWSGYNATGARTGGDLVINWLRRDRLAEGWLLALPLNEASEHYEVDVISGASAVRTITVSTPTASYSSAQQVTDFGTTQASVVIDIFQMSQAIGRGHALRATV